MAMKSISGLDDDYEFNELNKTENLQALMSAYYSGKEGLEKFAKSLPSATMLSSSGGEFESLRFVPSIISSKNISSKTPTPSGSPRSPRRSSLTTIDISVPEVVANAVADDSAIVMVFRRMGNYASSLVSSRAKGRNGKKGKGKNGKKTRRRAKK